MLSATLLVGGCSTWTIRDDSREQQLKAELAECRHEVVDLRRRLSRVVDIERKLKPDPNGN